MNPSTLGPDVITALSLLDKLINQGRSSGRLAASQRFPCGGT
jgi:hypothetical protein